MKEILGHTQIGSMKAYMRISRDKLAMLSLIHIFGTLTHKNLPLAIFLEEADLGYTAWSLSLIHI